MKSLIFALALSVLAVLTNGTTFSNPLRTRNGSDPFIVFVDGYYYLMTTTWRDVQLTRATTLEGLKTGETRTLYTMANPNPDGGNDVWAPELHQVNGTWYVYYSQDRKSWVLTGMYPYFVARYESPTHDGYDRRLRAMGHLRR
jgi:GH43 family beta-xylosidase